MTKKKEISQGPMLPAIKFKPKTKGQSDYLRCIAENDLTLCHGPPGTGKTFLASGMALQSLTEGKVKQIVITRPLIQCGSGLGFLKGSLEEKIGPYMTPIIEELIQLSSKVFIDNLIEQNIIKVLPLELMRGINFFSSFVIADEAENIDYGQFKMLLTRFGSGKMVVTGDVNQTDLRECDYQRVIDRLSNVEGIGVAELGPNDIVRSDLVGRILVKL